MKKILLFLLFSLSISVVFAQQGVITGSVIDDNTAEELIGVTVIIEGTTQGAVTDVFGSYRMNVEPGTYNLIFSYVSYANQKVEGVVVEPGGTTRIDMSMKEDVQQLEEIVIVAEQINNNEVALLKLQKKSLAVQDGISSVEMQRIGVTNSAESMRQVTGASVEGGKYVVMRGLGDRYSLTQMNGILMPSTDPYRNASSLDLIPSAMVENIVTTKTFTPDQPGSFTGGNVDVTTKSLPDQFYLSFGIGLTYNTNSSFRNNFLSDPIRGSGDVWGYSGSTRDEPAIWQDPDALELLSDPAIYLAARNPDEQFDPERAVFDEGAKSLSPEMVPTTRNSTLDNRYALSFGNRYDLANGGAIGFNAGFRLSRNWRYFDDFQVGIYEFSPDPGATSLNTNLDIRGPSGQESTNIGGLISLAYQVNPNNEFSIDYFYNHDGEISAQDLTGVWPGAISGPHSFTSRNISFTERQLQNIQLRAKHQLNIINQTKLSWVLGYINSTQDEPDIRIFANDETSAGFNLTPAEYDLPFHFWRNLEDKQFNAKIDFTTPIGREGGENRLKYGLWYSNKDRDFSERRFQLSFAGTVPNDEQYTSFRQADGDFGAFFNPETNMGVLDDPGTGFDGRNRYVLGNWYTNVTRPSNTYTGFERIAAAYLMGVFKMGQTWKTIVGARVETTDFEVESLDPNTPKGTISEVDVLPSLSFIKALNEDSNLRFGYSRTLARPNLRELAPFVSVDLIGGYFYLGNPELKRTLIDNVDVRWEVFPGPGQLIAVSGFYKFFNDPIVRVLNPVASGGQVSFENSSDATLAGLELEYRKQLGERFKLGANFTYTYSEVKLTDRELAARENVLAGTGIPVESTRPFQAQSPFIFNFTLTYAQDEKGFESTLYLNMFGRRLAENGFGGAPDVFEIYGRNDNAIPVPTINWTFSKRFTDKWELTLRFLNILNPEQVRNQEFNDQYFVTNAVQQGTGIMFGVKYNVYQLLAY